MQLNSNGKLARFYLFLAEDDKLPQDFCTYFWGLVFRAVVLFGTGGALVIGIVMLIVKVALFIWVHKAGTLVGVLSVLVIALTVWLSESKEKIKIEVLSEAKAIISAKVDAVKHRYCPRIDWKG